MRRERVLEQGLSKLSIEGKGGKVAESYSDNEEEEEEDDDIDGVGEGSGAAGQLAGKFKDHGGRDRAVLRFLISRCPRALVSKSNFGSTPIDTVAMREAPKSSKFRKVERFDSFP